MEMKASCDVCIHADICKNREMFEKMFEDESVMAGLDAVNNLVDWIELDVRCKHWSLDLSKNIGGYGVIASQISNEPEKKGLFGRFK